MKINKINHLKAAILTAVGALALAASAQAPHALGTVQAISATGITMTTAAGQQYTVSVPGTAKVLDLPPGSKSLAAATPSSLSDIAVGDRVLVNGSVGDTGASMTAERVIVMKATAIAQSHAADEEAWEKGVGGIVKSVDGATGTIMVSSGLKMITVHTTPATIVRHYAAGSIRFQDAMKSSVDAILRGDQLRVRGTESADGKSIVADEIVAGTFRSYSGVLSSIDATAGTVTLKDLATKKMVTVAVTSSSDVRRLPQRVAMGLAMKMHGQEAGGHDHAHAAAAEGAEQHAAAGRAGMSLSQMLSRLPTETLGGLAKGEAVMIVATSEPDGKHTAITLLAGVEPLLAAQPAGEGMALSPWSVGGAAPDGGDSGGGAQ